MYTDVYLSVQSTYLAGVDHAVELLLLQHIPDDDEPVSVEKTRGPRHVPRIYYLELY